tara:strand:+ start:214 stop:879 length:666 start_codon:yes stop_codon:yes gene_type:complete
MSCDNNIILDILACGHIICIMCLFKIQNCPICKKEINNFYISSRKEKHPELFNQEQKAIENKLNINNNNYLSPPGLNNDILYNNDVYNNTISNNIISQFYNNSYLYDNILSRGLPGLYIRQIPYNDNNNDNNNEPINNNTINEITYELINNIRNSSLWPHPTSFIPRPYSRRTDSGQLNSQNINNNNYYEITTNANPSRRIINRDHINYIFRTVLNNEEIF